ncbi:alpha-2-macroglobulin family protein [Paracoccus cavernae]
MAEFRQDRFAASLSWMSDSPFRLAYIVRAVTPGSFRHPAASVEDMYRPEYRAWTDGGTVAITP